MVVLLYTIQFTKGEHRIVQIFIFILLFIKKEQTYLIKLRME